MITAAPNKAPIQTDTTTPVAENDEFAPTSSEKTQPVTDNSMSSVTAPPPPSPPPLPKSVSPDLKADLNVIIPANIQGGVKAPAIRLVGTTGNKEFTDLYNAEASGQGNLASVNAGDTGFYLGGGTINGEFGKLLTGSDKPSGNAYADYHRKTLALQEDSRGFKVPDLTSGPAMPGVPYSIGLEGNGAKGEGSAFVHLFSDDNCPHGNLENRAMVYIVPPRGNDKEYTTDAAFLKAVQETAKNSLMVTHEYNLRAQGTDRPQLDVLRMCRFSSGHYARKGLDGARVAMAIQQGLMEASGDIQKRGEPVLVETIEFADGSVGKKLFSGANIHNQPAAPLGS